MERELDLDAIRALLERGHRGFERESEFEAWVDDLKAGAAALLSGVERLRTEVTTMPNDPLTIAEQRIMFLEKQRDEFQHALAREIKARRHAVEALYEARRAASGFLVRGAAIRKLVSVWLDRVDAALGYFTDAKDREE